jgi:hypothetical protein
MEPEPDPSRGSESTVVRRPAGTWTATQLKRWVTPPILEPVSGQVGLCFPGKVIFGGRDRTAITSVEAPKQSARNPETKLTRWNAPIWGYLTPPREISAVRRLIGGAIRTRTMDPLRLGMRDLRGEIASARSLNPCLVRVQ